MLDAVQDSCVAWQAIWLSQHQPTSEVVSTCFFLTFPSAMPRHWRQPDRIKQSTNMAAVSPTSLQFAHLLQGSKVLIVPRQEAPMVVPKLDAPPGFAGRAVSSSIPAGSASDRPHSDSAADRPHSAKQGGAPVMRPDNPLRKVQVCFCCPATHNSCARRQLCSTSALKRFLCVVCLISLGPTAQSPCYQTFLPGFVTRPLPDGYWTLPPDLVQVETPYTKDVQE